MASHACVSRVSGPETDTNTTSYGTSDDLAPGSDHRTAPTLATIPYDILHEIARYLTMSETAVLPLLSRAFHASVDPSGFSLHARTTYLRYRELQPQHRGDLACFKCLRLLPRANFGDSQAHGRRGKNGKSLRHIQQRFCLDCAREHRLYTDRKGVKWGGTKWYLCHGCGEFRVRSQRCTRERCWTPKRTESAEAAVVVVATRRAGRSAIESLPDGVYTRILENLEYLDALRLAQCSRHLHAVLRPARDTSEASREALLLARQYYDEDASRARNKVGCMSCFKVKSVRKFPRKCAPADQLGRRPLIRCWACIQRSWTGNPEALEETARWRNMWQCDKCGTKNDGEVECYNCVLVEARRWKPSLEDEMVEGLGLLWGSEEGDAVDEE